MGRFEEFLDQTRKQEFERDPGWQTVDEQQPVYTQQEYMEFERQRQQDIQRLIDQGLVRFCLRLFHTVSRLLEESIE